MSETISRTYARSAGLLYLIIIASGVYGEVVVRASLLVAGDAGATASNILAAPALFRTGFVADALMLLSDVAIAVLFYLLFKPVSQSLALLAAAFRLTQAAVIAASLLLYYAALLLLAGSEYAVAFEPVQRQALALLLLDLHGHGYDLGLLFFGISSFVLGRLVIRSEYFPSLLGYGLMVAGAVYLVGSLTRFLAPEYVQVVMPLYLLPLMAELAFCLWLLVKGVQTPRNT